MQEEHAAWVRNNDDGLRSAFAALQTEDAAHSHLFGTMTFEHFCERDSGEKRAAASGSTALPMEGMASHRTTESFEEMVGEERYFSVSGVGVSCHTAVVICIHNFFWFQIDSVNKCGRVREGISNDPRFT